MFENKKIQVKRRFVTGLIAYWPGLLLLILLSIAGSWYYLRSFSLLYRAEIKVSTGGQDNLKTADRAITAFHSNKLITEEILSRLHVSASRDLPGILALSIEDEKPQRTEDILKGLVKIYNASYPAIKAANHSSDLKLIGQHIAKVEENLLETERALRQNKNQVPAVHAAIIRHQKDEKALYTELLRKKEAAALALTLPARAQHVMNIVNVTIFPVLTGPHPRIVYLCAILAAIIIGFAIITIIALTGRETNTSLTSKTNDVKPASARLEAARQKITIAERSNKLKHSLKKALSKDNSINKNLELPEIIEKPRVGILERLGKLKFIKNNRKNIEPDSIYEFLQAAQETTPVELLPVATRNETITDSQQNITIAEQFSRLRQTLVELGINGDRKKVMITSAMKGEGKEFVATNLALSLALTGKKVVLLDFDIYQSLLGNKLGVNHKAGLSGYLKGNARFEDIILATEIDKNLFFIHAGEVIDHEYELKMSDLVTNLLNQLGTRFDHIIISAAPVRPFADAYALSALCDATLYIVRHAFSRKTFTADLNNFNILNRLKNAAVVFSEA